MLMTHSWNEAAKKSIFLPGETQLLGWGESQAWRGSRVPGPLVPATLSREAAHASSG